MSLKNKLISFGLFLSIIPTLFISFTCFELARVVLEKKVGFELLRVTLLVKSRIEAYALEKAEMLRVFRDSGGGAERSDSEIQTFLYQHPEFRELRFVRDADFLAKGDAVSWNEIPSKAVGIPRITLTMRGKFQGAPVLYALVDLEPIFLELSAYLVGKTGQIEIVDGSGRGVFHAGKVDRRGDAHIPPEIINGIFGGRTEFERVSSLSGEKFIVAYSRIMQWGGNIHWGLIMSQSLAESVALAKDLLNQIMLIGIVVLVVTIFAAVSIAEGISSPLRQLSMATRAVAAGKFGHRTNIQSSNEIGSLARAFDAMSQVLSDREETIARHLKEIDGKNMELEEANRLKTLFFNFMVHELRNPVTAFQVGLEVLFKNDKTSPRFLSAMNVMNLTCQRMNETINDLLDIAQMSQGKLKVVPEEFNLDDMIKEMEGQMRPVAAAKGLGLEITPIPSARVFGDRSKIQRILANLLSNAVKYTSKGKITLSAAVDGSRLRLTVSDTGIGLRPEDKENLFHEFERVDLTEVKAQIGNGLGLAFTKRLVDLLGGNISVESEFGRGSSFKVTLPVRFL